MTNEVVGGNGHGGNKIYESWGSVSTFMLVEKWLGKVKYLKFSNKDETCVGGDLMFDEGI